MGYRTADPEPGISLESLIKPRQKNLDGFNRKNNPCSSREKDRLEADRGQLENRIESLEKDRNALAEEKNGLETRIKDLNDQLNLSESDVQKLTGEKDRLEADRGQLENRIESLEKDRNALAEEKNGLETRIKDLNDQLNLSESKMQCLAKENRRLKKDSADLEETKRHLQKEMESMADVDVHDVVGPFLEFSAGVYNAVQDYNDIGTVKDLVCFRLDQLSGSFSGLGMELRFHRRGEPLTDGRVDATLVTTDDSNLNMAVMRSNKFGFSFGSDTVPDIIEEVSVYECVDNASAGTGDPVPLPTGEPVAVATPEPAGEEAIGPTSEDARPAPKNTDGDGQ